MSELSDALRTEMSKLLAIRMELLAHCASVADQVEATADTWGGREAAAEIARRIRSLMGDKP